MTGSGRDLFEDTPGRLDLDATGATRRQKFSLQLHPWTQSARRDASLACDGHDALSETANACNALTRFWIDKRD